MSIPTGNVPIQTHTFERVEVTPVICKSIVSTLMYYASLMRDIQAAEDRQRFGRVLQNRMASHAKPFRSVPSIASEKTRDSVLEIIDIVQLHEEKQILPFSLNLLVDYFEETAANSIADMIGSLQALGITTPERKNAVKQIQHIFNEDPAATKPSMIDSVRFAA